MSDQQTPPQEAGFFTSIRGWGIRRGDAHVLGGVASGLAERLGWSVGWTRVAVVAAALLTHGLGLLAYAAAWALLPDSQGRIVAQDFGRGVPNVGALIGIGIIGVLGLIGLSDGNTWGWNGGGWDGGPDVGGILRGFFGLVAAMFTLAVIAGAIALIVYLVRRNRDTTGTAQPRNPADGPPVYAAPPAWAADRQAQREASRQARDERRDYRRAQAYAAADEAVASANAAADGAAAAAQEASDAARQAAQPPYTYAGHTAPRMAPPRPPRPPRVPGPGLPFHLLNLAWFALSGAATAWAAWQGELAVNGLVAWFALYFTGLGVLIAIVALTGRRLGFLAVLSALLLVPAIVMIAQADEIRDGWGNRWLPGIAIEGEGDEVTRVRIGDSGIVIDEDGVRIGDDDIVIDDQGVHLNGGSEPTTEPSTAAPEPSSTGTASAGPAEVDAIAALTDGYSLIFVPSACDDDLTVDADGHPTGQVSTTGLLGERTVEATTYSTTVGIDEGTGIAIDLADDESVRVVWPQRGFACDVAAGDEFAAVAPTHPLVHIDPSPAVRYIVIEEVAS
ncbi:PspC domain-containing protein [Demequina mangrovi]|uniref:Phage shock protein C (PspC) family protein n=1 Tax=Demequina mangrovi TaxID=1043493 RepID=A0A1H6WM45_9MICO|nr:PspC domain-containing protein [Demequina mangrovi]SEJ17923.1 phage shock protein C (PspC) family protein [Demequina mangrovi]